MISVVVLSINVRSQRPSAKHACMISCNMLPHTSEGVTSDVEERRVLISGFRTHWAELAMEVAVMRTSGCKMRRFLNVDSVMVD